VLFSVFYAIGQSYCFLVIGAVFEGLSQSFYSGNNDALVYDILYEQKKEGEYAEWLGKLNSWFQIGLASAALLGGFVGNYSFALVMWFSALSQIVCLFLSFFLIEPKIHSQKKWQSIPSHERSIS